MSSRVYKPRYELTCEVGQVHGLFEHNAALLTFARGGARCGENEGETKARQSAALLLGCERHSRCRPPSPPYCCSSDGRLAGTLDHSHSDGRTVGYPKKQL